MQHKRVAQPIGGTTTTHHENWFQRMGKALIGVFIGWILMYFSLPVLWLNEKRAAKHEALIDQGEQDCRSISADEFSAANTHWLVHVNGETVSTKSVKDPQFNVSYESGVIRLSSTVEIYQWKEIEREEKEEEEDNFGGGKTTKTRRWKEYKQLWLETYDDGITFEKAEYRNTKPPKIEAGSKIQKCERVEFGKGFLLDEKQIDQLNGDEDAKIESLVCESNGDLKFSAADSGWYYAGKSSMTSPEIGDVRVKFLALSDGPTTVLGLQDNHKEEGRGAFLPYRVVARPMCPCFGFSEEEEKQALYEEAKKSKEDINDEDMWHGPMALCCCACNLVQFVLGALFMPEICNAFTGKLSKEKAFDHLRESASMQKWIGRLVGWIMMYIGLYLIFQPFLMTLHLLPLGVGAFLAKIAGFAIAVFAFMITLIMSSLIVAMAYTMYNPAKGILMWGVLILIIVGFIAMCNALGGERSGKTFF